MYDFFLHSLGQWPTFKLLGITYLVGKTKFILLLHGPLVESISLGIFSVYQIYRSEKKKRVGFLLKLPFRNGESTWSFGHFNQRGVRESAESGSSSIL